MNDQRTHPVKDRRQWLRLIFMLLYAIVLYLTMWVLGVVVLVQLVFKLATGNTQEDVAGFAEDLTTFINQIVCFLTYQTDTRPFPFNSLNESRASTADDAYTADYTVIDDDENQHNPR